MRKVMIVDADEGVSEFLMALLVEEGFQVSAVADSYQALKQLQQDDGTVVLLDLGWPYTDQSVHVWLQEVHHLSQHPVIAMSASAPVAIGHKLLSEHLISAFLSKPFEVEDVLAAVQQVAT